MSYVTIASTRVRSHSIYSEASAQNVGAIIQPGNDIYFPNGHEESFRDAGDEQLDIRAGAVVFKIQ